MTSFFYNHLTKIKFIVYLLFFYAFSMPISAGQLINNIPATLSDNWQVCSHFESKDRQCEIKKLPENYQVLDKQLQYQSYSKKFIISSELKNYPLALFLERIEDVDRILINGEQVGKTGNFLPNYKTGYRQKRLYYIPSKLLKFNKFNSIEIHVYSSRNITGIQSLAPQLGNYIDYQQEIQNTNYLYVVVFSILILLTIFPLFFYFNLKSQPEMLYFVFFLIICSVITLSRSQIPNTMGLNLNTILRIEFFMINLLVTTATLFYFKFFELEIRKYYSIGFYCIGIGALTIILWPNNVQLLNVIKINYWMLCGLSFFIVSNAMYISILKKINYSIAMAVVFSISWLVLCYDAVILTGHFFGLTIKLKPHIVSICVAFIGIVTTLVITHKYWIFFKGSTYDHLTGSLLRPAFTQRVNEEMQRCKRENSNLLVAVIDIQHTKNISINYGYNVGNHLLKSVTNSLTQTLKPYDLICKFSDDEFCVACSIKDKQEATETLDKIYNELINIQQPINENIELYIDAKIGGVIYDQELHLSILQIIQDANYALSKAKSQSKQSYLLEKSPLNQ